MDKEKTLRCLIVQYLESLIPDDPEHGEELGVSVECLKTVWGIGDATVSIPGVRSLIDLIPEPQYDTERAVQLKLEGNAALKNGDLDLALAKYTEAISVNPNEATFYCNRAAVYSKKGQHESAIGDGEKAFALDPKYATAYSRLGFAYFSLNNTEKARDAYQRGIRACPDSQALKDNLQSLGPAPAPPGGGADGLGGLFGGLAGNPMFAQIAERFKSPEVQAILAEPGMADLVAELQTNPGAVMSKMGDPRVQRILAAVMGSGGGH
jgi:tetratricopeptide (TPR) repeat protein